MTTHDRKSKTVYCPTCNTPVLWTKESRWRPFCSERCRLIDLGEWFEESHHIPGGTDHNGHEGSE